MISQSGWTAIVVVTFSTIEASAGTSEAELVSPVEQHEQTILRDKALMKHKTPRQLTMFMIPRQGIKISQIKQRIRALIVEGVRPRSHQRHPSTI